MRANTALTPLRLPSRRVSTLTAARRPPRFALIASGPAAPLRRSRGASVATPSADRWHERADAAPRRHRHLRSGSPSGSGSRSPSARSTADQGAPRHLRRHRARLRRRARRRPPRLPPLAKLAAQFAAAGDRARDRHARPARPQRDGRRRDRGPLAGRRDERVQPARQHGRARGDARRDRVRLLRDRRRHRPPERLGARLRARRRARLLSASCRSTSGRAAALVFMGDSGSQMLGFALAALGLVVELARRRDDRRDARSCRSSILAVPILDTTLVTIVRLLDGRPIHQGGRDHTSHRLVRFGLSERHAVALLALIALCARRLEPRLQRARQPALDDRRRRSSPSSCSCSSRASSPTSSAAPRRAATSRSASTGLRRPLAAPRRGRRRLRADHGRRSWPPTRSSSAGRARRTSASSPS